MGVKQGQKTNPLKDGEKHKQISPQIILFHSKL